MQPQGHESAPGLPDAPSASLRPGRLVRVARWSRTDKQAAAEALLMLAAASLAVAFLPFRCLARLIDRPMPDGGRDPDERNRQVARCRWAVNAWAERVPWRALCFQRGVAMHLMLRRRRIASVLHYGVAQDQTKGLHAHVWVDVDGATVMGGEAAPSYARLASFPAALQG